MTTVKGFQPQFLISTRTHFCLLGCPKVCKYTKCKSNNFNLHFSRYLNTYWINILHFFPDSRPLRTPAPLPFPIPLTSPYYYSFPLFLPPQSDVNQSQVDSHNFLYFKHLCEVYTVSVRSIKEQMFIIYITST